MNHFHTHLLSNLEGFGYRLKLIIEVTGTMIFKMFLITIVKVNFFLKIRILPSLIVINFKKSLPINILLFERINGGKS